MQNHHYGYLGATGCEHSRWPADGRHRQQLPQPGAHRAQVGPGEFAFLRQESEGNRHSASQVPQAQMSCIEVAYQQFLCTYPFVWRLGITSVERIWVFGLVQGSDTGKEISPLVWKLTLLVGSVDFNLIPYHQQALNAKRALWRKT